MTYLVRVKTLITYIGAICVSISGLYFLSSATRAVLRYADVNQDAGTFLSVIARINEGYLLYRDIANAYMPLVFYVTSFLSKNVAHPDYSFYLFVAWCHVILCGLVMALVVQHETSNLFLSISVATLIPLIALQFEGYFFLLEPFVALFAILSFFLVLKSHDRLLFGLLSGCAAGLAFMCKQYGLGILPSICLIAWMSDRSRKYSMVGSVLVGFVLSVSLTVGYVLSSSNLTLQEFIRAITPALQPRITQVPPDFWVSIACIIPFFVLAVLLLFYGSVRHNRMFVGAIVAVLGFAPQLLFRQHRHYFLLMIPFMVLLWGLQFNFVVNRKSSNFCLGRALRLCILVWTIPLFVYSFGYSSLLSRRFNATNPRLDQLSRSARIHQFVPPGSRVVLLLDPAFYFLCNFLPVQDIRPGYAFLDNFSGAEIAGYIQESGYVILSRSDYFYFGRPERLLAESGIQLFELLRQGGFKQIGTVDVDIEIWRKASVL